MVPTVAAVLSAWGMLATDLRYEMVRSHVSEVSRMTPAALRKIFAAMEDEGRARLSSFSGPVQRAALARHALRRADLRDRRASTASIWTAPTQSTRWSRASTARHEELYAYSAPGQEVVIVNARVAVIGASCPALRAEPARRPTEARTVTPARRRVYLGDWVEVPVYGLDGLAPGQSLEGPGHLRVADHDRAGPRGRARRASRPHGWLDIALG